MSRAGAAQLNDRDAQQRSGPRNHGHEIDNDAEDANIHPNSNLTSWLHRTTITSSSPQRASLVWNTYNVHTAMKSLRSEWRTHLAPASHLHSSMV
jgi:hypothetical protein